VTRKRQVAPECQPQTHSTFSKSVMVSIPSLGVSKLRQVDLIFIDVGVKITGAYYCEVLLTQKLLPSCVRSVKSSLSCSKKEQETINFL